MNEARKQRVEELKKIISKEELNQYYNIENHTWKDTLQTFATKYETSGLMIIELIRAYDIRKDKKVSKLLCEQTKIEKYGDKNYNNINKIKETCVERYGVDNQFKRTEMIKESYRKKFGVDHPMKDKAIAMKVASKIDYVNRGKNKE